MLQCYGLNAYFLKNCLEKEAEFEEENSMVAGPLKLKLIIFTFTNIKDGKSTQIFYNLNLMLQQC